MTDPPALTNELMDAQIRELERRCSPATPEPTGSEGDAMGGRVFAAGARFTSPSRVPVPPAEGEQ